MNKIIVSGRTTNEFKVTNLNNENQTLKGSFGFAVNRPKGSKQTVDYFNCEVYGKIVETHAQCIKKGSLLNITGVMHIDRDTENPAKTYPKIIAEEIEYLETKKED